MSAFEVVVQRGAQFGGAALHILQTELHLRRRHGLLRPGDPVADHLLLRRREPLTNREARDSARSFFSSNV